MSVWSREPGYGGGGLIANGTRRAVLTALIDRVTWVSIKSTSTCSRPAGALLDIAATPLPSVTDDESRSLSIPVRLRRTGWEIRMQLEGGRSVYRSEIDMRLIKLLARAAGQATLCRKTTAFRCRARPARRVSVVLHPGCSPQLSRP